MGNQKSTEECRKGDMIKFQRVAYAHWGIYVGDGYIVHLTGDIPGAVRALRAGETDKLAEIRKEKLQNVAGNDKWEVSNYLDCEYQPKPGDVIAKHALKLVGVRRKYDLLVKNCEHLATLLRYGKEYSQQVEDAAEQNFIVALGRDLAEVFY